MPKFFAHTKRYPSALPILTILSVIALGLIISQQKWGALAAAKQQQQQFIREYGSLFLNSAVLKNDSVNGAKADLSSLAPISIIAKACLYRQNNLEAALTSNPDNPCSASTQIAYTKNSSNIKTFFPFVYSNQDSGLLVLETRSPKVAVGQTELLTLLLLSIFGVSAWLSTKLYFKQQQSKFGISDTLKLEALCKDIVHHRNHSKRAEGNFPHPLKNIALAINAMLDELQQNENLIQEKSIQLQEKADLLEAQKKAHMDRSQNLHKMFAGASHDLRQPLQAMTIFISAIKETAQGNQRPLIQKLEQVLDNLNDLFTDLLDISKLESRMQRIPKKTVKIKPLLAKIFDEFEALATEKNIELRLFQQDVEVYSNPNMLERIIRNMISNAIRYTRTGGVLIGSRRRKEAIWIEVWDTGRGIPAEKMTEIFTEFVQLKDEDSEPNKGVGLGLFIVKKLAQLLDHSITVKSKLRRGTLFRVIVPTHLVDSPVHQLPRQMNNGSMDIQPEIAKPQKARILLLDDDDTVRAALIALIQSWNMEVIGCVNLDQALNQLKSAAVEFDLILSDFQLEEQCNGLEAIQVIRTNTNQQKPAILISGTDDQVLLSQIQESGIPFLKKPVKPAKLRALIHVLTEKNTL